MIRVLHVIPDLGLGGAQRTVLDMLKHSPQYGIESILCVLYGAHDVSRFGQSVERITFLDSSPGIRSPAGLLRLGSDLRRVFRAFQPDVIHSHLRPADMVVAGSLR